MDTEVAVVVDTAADRKAQKRTSKLLASLSGLLVVLAFISTQFDYTLPFSLSYTSINVLIMMFAGSLFACLFYPLNFHYPIRTIILIGVLLRLAFMVGPPILEDDMYRYFFDGSLITHGLNPFEHSPSNAYSSIEKGIVEDIAIEANSNLAYLHEIEHFKRVAYPTLTTIYPLTAQAFFALSALINEFDISVWRLLLFLTELCTLFLLYRLLLILKQSPVWLMAYWLNPVVITEGINAAHMDVLLVPFLLLAVLSLYHLKSTLSGVCLGLAVGVKIWPLLLAPLFLVFTLKQAGLKKTVYFSLSFTLSSVVVLLPMLLALEPHAGVVNYSQQWHVNSFLFSLLNSVLFAVNTLFDDNYISVAIVSRIVVAGGLFAFILTCGFRLLTRVENSKSALFHLTVYYSFWSALILFLVSPTGYPWYAFWFLPFWVLVANKRTKPVVLFAFTLPLYDLRYIFQTTEHAEYWQWMLVTCAFLPIIVLLTVNQFLYFRKSGAKIQQ